MEETTFFQTVLSFLATWWWVGLVLLIIPFSKLIFGWVFIKESENGVVIRKWGGKSLPEGRIIATEKESGIWAKMLSPGLKLWYWPWMYSIRKQPITIVPQGSIAHIEAIDGDRLPQGNILSRKSVECNNFTNGVAFLDNGGIKGYQPNYIANGEYRINTELFKVTITPLVNIPEGHIGTVTTLDGKPLISGNIAGAIIPQNNTFQDVNLFLENGGYKGMQEEILMPGDYHIHPKFAQVDVVKMTRVPVGFVGVVNSFIGEPGRDVSGDNFKHGNIVSRGQKGIWNETLDPGLYEINPQLQEILFVPTTNIVLNWADEATESHGFDSELGTINVRSKDGFNFTLEVSQIINISNKTAPHVIARFGTVENLIDQVLEPTIGNYFRNSAQTSEALTFVYERAERQADAKKHIDKRLEEYNITGVDSLIGDIDAPKVLMDILADQEKAKQEQEMFVMQTKSEEKRQEFVKAQTAANKEEELTASDYHRQIATKDAEAKVEKAKGDRESAKIAADGEAYVLTTVGKAKALNTREVGNAEAEVIEKKTEAMGQSEYASVLVAEALAQGKIEIVPKVLIQGSGEGAGGTMVDALLGTEFLKKQGMFKKEEVKEDNIDRVSSPEKSGDKKLTDDKKD